MRIMKCDVCGEEYGPDEDMVEMAIPASFVDEEESLLLDVCSWQCVSRVVDTAIDRVNEDEEEEEKSEKTVIIPKTPTINVDMDPKKLAQFTEQVTGVKRRS